MPALPPEAFSGRSWPEGQEVGGISRFSRLEFPRMLMVFDSATPGTPLAKSRRPVLPSPHLNVVGT
jgi:hypothetical protein